MSCIPLRAPFTLLALTLGLGCLAPSLTQAATEPPGGLTRKQAIDHALKGNQMLAAKGWQVESGKAATLQAGLLPNPELGVEAENFGGEKSLSGFDGAETTFSVSQLIELGGKRSKRRHAASRAADALVWEYKKTMLDLVADTAQAFVDVLAKQQRLSLAREQQRLAEQVLATVRARVEAGKVSPIDATKAQIALSTSRIALTKAQLALVVGRKNLAAFWGSEKPVFKKAAGNLDIGEHSFFTLEELAALALKHPDLARLVAEVEQREAELKLARAARLPDLTISGGVRNFEETNNNAFVASVSMPLMLFDRNQGGIAEARHNLSQARSELAAATINLQARLSEAYQNLVATESEANTLEREVLPGARITFDAVQEGYRYGKFGFLDVLDAQKTFFEVTINHIDALSAYHSAAIDVRRLAGIER